MKLCCLYSVLIVTSFWACNIRSPSPETLLGTWEIAAAPSFHFVFSSQQYRILYKGKELLQFPYSIESSILYHTYEDEKKKRPAGKLSVLEDQVVELQAYVLPDAEGRDMIPEFLRQEEDQTLILRKTGRNDAP